MATDFANWTDDLCGDDELGCVAAVRGDEHEHLGVVLDCLEPGTVEINMDFCIKI